MALERTAAAAMVWPAMMSILGFPFEILASLGTGATVTLLALFCLALLDSRPPLPDRARIGQWHMPVLAGRTLFARAANEGVCPLGVPLNLVALDCQAVL
ncbi:hypothetical protein IFM12275_28910 [Nocardia sputorum]|nr:hypothetical protein IFM12275_28910 [Nocardia sputorum]